LECLIPTGNGPTHEKVGQKTVVTSSSKKGKMAVGREPSIKTSGRWVVIKKKCGNKKKKKPGYEPKKSGMGKKSTPAGGLRNVIKRTDKDR